MVQTSLKLLTLDEFLTLPETEPASEYIDGQITQKPMPQGKHSSIQTELATRVVVVTRISNESLQRTETTCGH